MQDLSHVPNMKLLLARLISPLFLLTFFIPQTQAHTRFTTLHINGVSQGDGKCIRQDHNPDTTTNFLPSLTDPTMACGVDGSLSVPDTCSLNAGDSMSLEHRMWPDGSQPGAIDVSHKGNTAIYMKKITSLDDEVTGDGWFKIFWNGYDISTSMWGTDRMNENNGLVTTAVPNDLAAGLYLVRSEVLALQQVGDPQFYVGCAQVKLEGSGNVMPGDTVQIPGYVTMATPAMNVNIYESFTFEEYGPMVHGSGGKSGTNATTASAGVKQSGSTSSDRPSTGENGRSSSDGTTSLSTDEEPDDSSGTGGSVATSTSALVSGGLSNQPIGSSSCGDEMNIDESLDDDDCDASAEDELFDDDCSDIRGYHHKHTSDDAATDDTNAPVSSDNIAATSEHSDGATSLTSKHAKGDSWERWNHAHRRFGRSIGETSRT